MKASFTILLAAIVSIFTGCATTETAPALTPIQIQLMQTRSYQESQNVVFRSIVSVFQDMGYIIKNADSVTGFIQADGIAQSNENLKYWTGHTETTQTKATGFVEQIGSKTQVRLNFVTTKESSTAYGADDRKETPVLDAQIYQNAFERIENAIFVRKSTN
jgi:hypothetical protein